MKFLLTAILLLLSAQLFADLKMAGAHGFTVTHSIDTTTDPFYAYRTMTSHVNQWWSEDHTWSGNAANLYMEMEQGGCLCERLTGKGIAEHLRIIYYAAGEEVRFEGALGPLQAMPVTGRMIWNIDPIEGGSRITFTYHVFGHVEGGLQNIAPAVDGVIGEQIARLSRRLNQNQ